MATGKRRTTGKRSKIDATLSEPFQWLLEQAPAAFAVTRGKAHTLIYANAAFRAIPGTVPAPTPAGSVLDLFDAAVTTRLAPLLERAVRERAALHEQFLGPLEEGGRAWSCTVWPVLHDAQLPHGLVIELSVATHLEAALSLQRSVAERLLLSVLRESDAAEGAEASHQRAAFLATAGRHLAESLDTDTTRTSVAELTLPALAEWCIVDLLGEDDTMQRLSIIHRDPRKQALVSQLESQWSPEAGDPFGVPAVVRNAQPVLITDNVDQALATAAHGSENLRILRELGIGPLLTVPLIGENRVFGAITFVSEQRERPFTAQDIELAEGLAARSALALEKARRYGDALVLRDKAETAAKTATKFLGTISHELRTPLNAISGYAELIAEGVHGPVTDAQRVALERIISSQQNLLVLIGELLDFVRIGSGRVALEAVDVPLEGAVTRAVELLEPLIAKKGLTYKVVAAPTAVVAADPDRVHQILVNLISNALKFTKRGGEITIVCKATQDSAIVTVSDNGRGIPPDKIDLIFEPFVLAHDDDAKEHGGIGLGLPISRDLARAMHGDLTVESTLGKGSKFTLTLPAAQSA